MRFRCVGEKFSYFSFQWSRHWKLFTAWTFANVQVSCFFSWWKFVLDRSSATSKVSFLRIFRFHNHHASIHNYFHCSQEQNLSCNFPHSTKNTFMWGNFFSPFNATANNATGNFSLDRYSSSIMTVFLDNTCHDYLQRFWTFVVFVWREKKDNKRRRGKISRHLYLDILCGFPFLCYCQLFAEVQLS